MASREVKQRMVEVSSRFKPEQSDQAQHRLVYQYHVRIIDPDSKQEHIYDRELAFKQQVKEVSQPQNTEQVVIDSPPQTPQVIMAEVPAARPETYATTTDAAPPVTEDILQQAVVKSEVESEAILALTEVDLNEQASAPLIDKSIPVDKPIVQVTRGEDIITDSDEFYAEEIDPPETPVEVINSLVVEHENDQSIPVDKPVVEATQVVDIVTDSDKFNAEEIGPPETTAEVINTLVAGQESIAKYIDIELPVEQGSALSSKLRALVRLFHPARIRRPALSLNTGKQKLSASYKQFSHFMSPGRFFHRFRSHRPNLSLNTCKQKLSTYLQQFSHFISPGRLSHRIRTRYLNLSLSTCKQKLLLSSKQLSRFSLKRKKNQLKSSSPSPVQGNSFLFRNKRVALYTGIVLLLIAVVATIILLLPAGQDKNPLTKTTSPVSNPAPNDSNEAEPTYQARIEHDAQGYTITLAPANRTQLDLKPVTTPSVSTTNTPTNEIIHIVVAGDTLWFIAKRYVHDAMRYPELAQLSNIKNPHRIYPGDRVRIVQNPTPSP